MASKVATLLVQATLLFNHAYSIACDSDGTCPSDSGDVTSAIQLIASRKQEAMHAAQHVEGRAKTHRFYVYRAQSEAEYPFGNVNAANLPGIMWYLTNEVIPHGCPLRYGIIRISRVIVTTRATPELYARGMNYGIRYTYDSGQCTGSNTADLGKCDLTFSRFGHVVGCNNFKDHYPWPKSDTNYPDGVWYDFPGEGKCNSPTGTWNCTWSVEAAGEINIERELQPSMPGKSYCCAGCTDFWSQRYTPRACQKRVEQVKKLFKKKYPNMPADLPAGECDFDRKKFWAA